MEPVEINLKKGPVSDDVRTADFLYSVCKGLKHMDKCAFLCDWLHGKCAATAVGILKQTCTAVTFKKGIKEAGLMGRSMCCVNKHIGAKFKVAEDDSKVATATTGGPKAKKNCKHNKGTLTAELGLTGVADIKL
eukprot:1911006-Pleurochrysis_carterae.AAC.2